MLPAPLQTSLGDRVNAATLPPYANIIKHAFPRVKANLVTFRGTATFVWQSLSQRRLPRASEK